MEGETVPTEVCSDVEKELRTIEVTKPLFATQKALYPQEGIQSFPKENGRQERRQSLAKIIFPLKGTKEANVHS